MSFLIWYTIYIIIFISNNIGNLFRFFFSLCLLSFIIFYKKKYYKYLYINSLNFVIINILYPFFSNNIVILNNFKNDYFFYKLLIFSKFTNIYTYYIINYSFFLNKFPLKFKAISIRLPYKK